MPIFFCFDKNCNGGSGVGDSGREGDSMLVKRAKCLDLYAHKNYALRHTVMLD